MGLDLSGFDTPAHHEAQHACRHVIGCAVDAITRLNVITRLHHARGINPEEVVLCLARLGGPCCLPPDTTPDVPGEAVRIEWTVTVAYDYLAVVPLAELAEAVGADAEMRAPSDVPTGTPLDLLLTRYEHAPVGATVRHCHMERVAPHQVVQAGGNLDGEGAPS